MIIHRFYGRWAFLSNFFPAVLTWEGITYPSAEHAYNAAKTLDIGLQHAIAYAETPRLAKKMGRKLADLRPGWEGQVRFQAMAEILRAKFTYHPARIQALISTRDAVLIEGNRWHDQVWGDCYCGRLECLPAGRNCLGLALTALRESLRDLEMRPVAADLNDLT